MQSNINVKCKQRCLLFAKTQQIYSKNRSRLAKSIFDGEDITKKIMKCQSIYNLNIGVS